MTDIRFDWTAGQLLDLYERPLLDLVWQAQTLHRRYHDPADIQRASLLSIKTGGCPEDCAYCPQSAHFQVASVERQALLPTATVLEAAARARDAGADRFCMGAAWRQVRDGAEFDRVCAMVRGVRALGMEACVTLGMLKAHQAERLAEAGLTAYNHNLDSSEDFYGQIITTRTYADRLETLDAVRAAGIAVCSGGILGMGESRLDRCQMLAQLASADPHPESVPLNLLEPVPGTPLASAPPLDPLELVRACATARIAMPRARVRLSAGRKRLSREAQLLCLLAGANAIFYGDTLLTTGNPDVAQDDAMLAELVGQGRRVEAA